jgi:hypothetical protein
MNIMQHEISTEWLESVGCGIYPSIQYGAPLLFAYDLDSRLFAHSTNDGSSWNERISDKPFRFRVKAISQRGNE